MRICVFGAGSVGGYLAAFLAKGGADVSVVARGAHLAAIRANGLTVETPDGAINVRLAASDNPADLGAAGRGDRHGEGAVVAQRSPPPSRRCWVPTLRLRSR